MSFKLFLAPDQGWEERKGVHEFLAKNGVYISPTTSKVWICSTLDLKAQSGIKPGTGVVSDAMSMQPTHPALNVLGKEPTPQHHTPPRPSLIFLPALAWAPQLASWKTSFPSHSDCVDYTFWSLVFLRVGRNSCTTASILLTEVWVGKEMCVLGADGIYCLHSWSHWDLLSPSAHTSSSLADPPDHLSDFSNCTTNEKKI